MHHVLGLGWKERRRFDGCLKLKMGSTLMDVPWGLPSSLAQVVLMTVNFDRFEWLGWVAKVCSISKQGVGRLVYGKVQEGRFLVLIKLLSKLAMVIVLQVRVMLSFS